MAVRHISLDIARAEAPARRGIVLRTGQMWREALVSKAEHTVHETTAHETTTHETHARFGSGIATIYEALDRLVSLRELSDAALVVDVAPLGRQVLRAGRRPLHDDETGLLTRDPGLYVEPSTEGADTPDDLLVAELMVTLAELGLQHDVARMVHEESPA